MMETPVDGAYRLGDRIVRRVGYGAMQLTGPGAAGPPKDAAEAVAVLREAVESGVQHIDTSDFYGPHTVNMIIREALAPYAAKPVIITKVGVARGGDTPWRPAVSAAELEAAVCDNLRNLGVDVLDVVNLRAVSSAGWRAVGDASIEAPFTALAELQRRGLIRHLGLSNVTAAHVAQARAIAPVVCVQNHYNVAHREDDALVASLAADGIAYVPFFPLGGLTPLQSQALSDVAARLGATPMQVALAWLLRRAPNILPIPGTSSVAHLRENLASSSLELSDDELLVLDDIAAEAEPAA